MDSKQNTESAPRAQAFCAIKIGAQVKKEEDFDGLLSASSCATTSPAVGGFLSATP